MGADDLYHDISDVVLGALKPVVMRNTIAPYAPMLLSVYFPSSDGSPCGLGDRVFVTANSNDFFRCLACKRKRYACKHVTGLVAWLQRQEEDAVPPAALPAFVQLLLYFYKMKPPGRIAAAGGGTSSKGTPISSVPTSAGPT